MRKVSMKKPEPKKRGPPPELLKLKGDWTKNVKKALEKKKPPDGWPKSAVDEDDKEPQG